MPQILTNLIAPRRPAGPPDARPARRPRPPGPRPGRASRRPARPGSRRRASRAASCRAPDARFGHRARRRPGSPRRPARPARCRPRRCARSRWLTPTSVAPSGQRPVELRLVVDLDQRVEADARPRGRRSRRARASLERGDDQQDRVGPHQPGVVDVGDAHGEVLAQHRQADGRPGGEQVGRRAAEVLAVGQDGQARRAAGRVLGGHARPGRGPGRDRPFDGERRLTSAMTATPPVAAAASAAANPRAGGRSAAASRRPATSRSSAAAASGGPRRSPSGTSTWSSQRSGEARQARGNGATRPTTDGSPTADRGAVVDRPVDVRRARRPHRSRGTRPPTSPCRPPSRRRWRP